MKNFKIIALSLCVLATIVVASGFSKNTTNCQKSDVAPEIPEQENQKKQGINLFVTHGHCSTPFGGIVENLKVVTNKRWDLGNPLENMKISFDIDPNSFIVCRGDELTAKIRTPGLFIGENNEMITFRSTRVFTMGMDWYQVNGKLSIKGVVKDVKLFVTGIRDSKNSMPSIIVLEGKMNLLDWGIDYDKIVNGKSDSVPTKWMYINMKIDMC